MADGRRAARTREEARRILFGRFAGWSARCVSNAPFFAFCVQLVVVWAPSYLLVGNVDTHQPIINTPTTIFTFLLVALPQNTQRRSEQAVQKKLDAIADGLSDLMDHFAGDEPDRVAKHDLSRDIEDLRAAVGLEEAL
jgi:low affinity Fe/Cu permease